MMFRGFDAGSLVRRCFLAIGLAAGALGLRLLFDPFFATTVPFLPFTIVVVAISLWAGTLPGLAVTVLCGVSDWYLFVDPHFTPAREHSRDALNFLSFVVIGILSSVLCGQLRRMWRRNQNRESRLVRIFELLPQLVWMANPLGVFETVNDRWVEYFGTPALAHLEFGWLQQVHPDDRSRVHDKWSAALATGASFQMEFRLRDQSGAYRWFSSRAIASRDREGHVIEWIGSHTDIHELREMRRTLQNEAERLRRVAATAPGVIFTFRLSADGKYSMPFASPGITEIYGVAPEQLAEDFSPIPRAMHPEDVALFHQSLAESTRTLSTWRMEHRMTHPERGELWIEIHSMPSREPDGSTVWYGFLTDVTQRKRAEKSARQWERAFEQSELSISLDDPKTGKLQAVNQSFARQRGYAPQELTGSPILALYAASDTERVQSMIEEVDRTGGHVLFESVHARKDGGSFPVRVDLTAVRDESGAVVSRIAIIGDLTEEKLAQQKLHRSEALYRAIASNIPDTAIYVVDQDLRYTAIEGTLAGRIAPLRDALEGRTVAEVLDRQELARIEPIYRRCFRGEQTTFDWKAGEQICECQAVPLRNEAGEVIAAMTLLQDITQRKKAETEILRLNASLEERVRNRTAQLEAANKELESFAYSVSHDLRAPLRGIDGWSLALVQDYASKLPQEAQVQLDRVRSETQRMGDLIDDLLKLSQVTRTGMTPQPVNLSRIVSIISARLKSGEPGRSIEFEIEPGLGATGDARLLEIALTNLLENAVKFTRRREYAKIKFGLISQPQSQAFYVADNGVGFNMAYASNLFGAFQRFHRASEFPGSGIGLATVERIIRRHGGRIWAEAEQEKGATFFFSLEDSK